MAVRHDLIDRFTREFDHHDPEYTPDISEAVNRAVRENAAATYSAAHGGFWIIARYDEVKAALKDHETFSSGSGVHFPRAAGMPKFSPIDYDPPEHRALRQLMMPPMERSAIRRLEPAIRELAADLIRPIADRGHGDLAGELALPFAISTLGLAIGLSDRAQREIRELTRNMWRYLSADSDADRFWPAFHSLLSEEIRAAREHPTDRYLSRLVTTEVDDDTLYSVIVSYCVAGHDNPKNTLSRVLWCLARDPDLQRRVRAEPDLMAGVGEETMRRWCPTDRLTRVTTREVTVDGVTIPAGARVVLLFDAANRDPDKFPDPEEFRVERENARDHVSFGYGIHHCIGANLARMEIKALLTELARHPVYHLTEEPRRHFENGRHIVFPALPVRFEKG